MKRYTATHFRRYFLLCYLLFLCICSVHAQPPSHTGKFSPYIDYNVNGFWEYIPRNYDVDVSTKYPLIVFFHGAGEQGSDQSETTLNKVLRAGPPKLINNGNFPDSFLVAGVWHKFIVISPQIKDGIAGSTSIIQPSTVEAVIQYAISTYRVDPARIYLCGLSMGGGAVWDYAGSSLSAASKLAAIMVAAGAGDLSTAEANNIAEGDLPVLATHNRDDNVIEVSRTEANISAIQSYTPAIVPPPTAVYWDLGGHNVWRRTYEDILPGTTPNGNLRDTLGRNAYEWLLENSRPSLALPVTWQSFTVRAQNGKAFLQWIVSSQLNVKEYVVEKSINGTQWAVASSVSAGAGTNALTYSFTDPATGAGVSFYRIKQLDYNGRFSYSAIKTFSLNASGKMLVYPNPFGSTITIDADLPVGDVVIRVTDGTGKIVASGKHAAGNREIVIAGLEKLSGGSYYLTILDLQGKVIRSSRIVKK